jgi:hypothetical protein
METAFSGTFRNHEKTWLRKGCRGTIKLAIGKDQKIPNGFKTEQLANGRRIGEVPVTIVGLCVDGCHAEVRLDDPQFSTIFVEVEDVAALAKA